jgi:hypothetical protein
LEWIIIALHQALYGALITTLQGTDSRQTVIDRQKEPGKVSMLHVNSVPIDIIASSFRKDQETMRDWLTHPFLISIDEDLRRVRNRKYLPALDNVNPLVTIPAEDGSIRVLIKEFRNEFEHFAPKSWVINTTIFPPITRDVLRVIHFLVLQGNCNNMS